MKRRAAFSAYAFMVRQAHHEGDCSVPVIFLEFICGRTTNARS
jgi:hypothetical protein